ncbi:MAG: energy transducer TonB [Pseudomonadota bacterium]
MSDTVVTAKDRFSFSLFLALTLHAALILGVGFSSDLNTSENLSIDVTLSVANDQIVPEEADFIAADNQLGSGSEADVQDMTTREEADFHNNEMAPVLSQVAPMPEISQQQDKLLTTVAPADESAQTELQELTELLEAPADAQMNREKLVQEIASLEARIAQDQQALAKMPRTKRINTVTTRSAAEAAYLNMWRQKCERIGRINYPAGQLEGEVLMLVSIMADGSLEEVRVLKSSGHRELDRAALTTVRQAAPFQPFNVEMRKDYDRLEFTRTWQFSKSGAALGG